MVGVMIPIAIYLNLLLKQQKPTAMLKGGVWARTDQEFQLSNDFNMQTIYSYSELKDLLRASLISCEQISSDFSEVWMITPTKPFSEADINRIDSWVLKGGHLVVVSDHTDIYGHARALNPLLKRFGLRTSTTAFFPLKKNQVAQSTYTRDLWLKTSNVNCGLLIWPQVTARWIEERADYSGDNFFGEMRYTSDDGLGRKVIAGTKAYGLGEVTLFGDSTIFANFAIFQPYYIQLLENLRHVSIMPFLFPVLILVLTGGLFLKIMHHSETLLYWAPLIGILALVDFGTKPVSWGTFEYWSGDPRAVMEWEAPRVSVSTAYAFSSLSGIHPRWVTDPSLGKTGFWVSPEKPPYESMRWIDLSEAKTDAIPFDRRFQPLLQKITTVSPKFWPEDQPSLHLNVVGVWSNDTLGDWWVDRGISQSKARRISAWLSWLKKETPPPPLLPISFSEAPSARYRLTIPNKMETELLLPKIPFRKGEQVLVGRGITLDCILLDGKDFFLGTAAHSEAWEPPKYWLLEELPQKKQD